MSVTSTQRQVSENRGDRSLPIVVCGFFAGALAATLGSYWDDAWHTNRGRDSFLIPPHLCIYAGVLVAGTALAAWAGWQVHTRGTRVLREDRAVVLALLSVGVTLGAAPIDNFWHVSFGRDAVIWSPPHVLGILGLLALSVSLIVLVSSRDARWVGPVKAALGGSALTAATFLCVEYETDVPQFSERYYLPVLTLVTLATFVLLGLANPGPWTATKAAVVHFVLVALAAVFLLAVGWDA